MSDDPVGGEETPEDDGPTHEQFDAAFALYAAEIGYLVQSWNMMQDELGKLFAVIINRSNINIGSAVWNSSKSDRAQRDMLKSAVNAYGAVATRASEKAKDDILWFLDKIEKFEDRRNNAVHAPMQILFNIGSREFYVEPWIFGNNPRAKRLKDKELLAELRWYRQTAAVFRRYATSLHVHYYMNNEGQWPERPQLPAVQKTRG